MSHAVRGSLGRAGEGPGARLGGDRAEQSVVSTWPSVCGLSATVPERGVSPRLWGSLGAESDPTPDTVNG